MKTLIQTLVPGLIAALVSTAALAQPQIERISPVLADLLEFHPGWITRAITSHDPSGGNADGSGKGLGKENGYHVLFHAKGEGRILRLWMTVPNEKIEKDYRELWIVVDGKTAYRGPVLNFFNGQAGWRNPLVYNKEQSSGAFLSYVPFPYASEAKILFRGDPYYYQVTFREGPGAAQGPTADEIVGFLGENWNTARAAEQSVTVRNAPVTLAVGPATLSRLTLRIRPSDLKNLRLRITGQDIFPLAYLFGLASTGEERDGGWAPVRTAISTVRPEEGVLESRLPIILQNGQRLELISSAAEPLPVSFGVSLSPRHDPTIRMLAQYRDQMSTAGETTMNIFKAAGRVHFVSLVEEVSDGLRGNRLYLEGDEMLRTDGMKYPLQLGTGTEDYYNGGWYFEQGMHTNAFSGLARFDVIDPEDGWKHALFEHSLYRHHILDPVVGRAGMSFGFEAGETGSYAGVRYRTLALAYAFEGPKPVRHVIDLGAVKTEGLLIPALQEWNVRSSFDAEKAAPEERVRVRYSRGVSRFSIPCLPVHSGLLLLRTYDAKMTGQQAAVYVNGRLSGLFFDPFVNRSRRLAQDALWVDLFQGACSGGSVEVRVDGNLSQRFFTEGGYEAMLF